MPGLTLFTIIMEYRGGTYIAQVSATTPESALRNWAAQINPIDIAWLGKARKAELVDAIDKWLADGERAVAISGTKNVWCHSDLIGGFLMLINLVATTKRAVSAAKQ